MQNYLSTLADSGSLASWVKTATENELAQLERDLPLISPGMLAQSTSQGKWKRARHLAYLDRAILDAIEQAAVGQLDGLVVSMPPQHGKSELCSKYLPAWYLGLYPDRRVILTSYEADFASSWGRKSRDVLERHGGIFGVRVSKRSGAVHRWDIEGRDGGMTTAGVGGAITGKGAHLLIVDDPVKNDEEARSATYRQKAWDWWQAVASTRMRPGGLFVVIQTRWHRDDLTGRILEHARQHGQRWRQIKFPAIAEEQDELGRQPGEALWPEMYPALKLEQIKNARTNYYWQSMYQQNPQAEGSAEWPDSFFGPEIWFEHWPANPYCKAIALDPSKGTESKFGDYSAFVLVMVDRTGIIYVDAIMEKWNTSLIVDQVLELNRSFRPDWIGVEVNQFQELLLTIIVEQCKKRQLLMPPLFAMTNQIKKQVRIRRLTPQFAQRFVRFKGGSKGARLLVEQLRDFPNGDHDDGPDALEMAIRLIAEQLWQAQFDRADYAATRAYWRWYE